MIQLTKDEIREWLISHKRDRDWLAEACGVAKGTVDNWFSNRPIPESSLATIRLLMDRDLGHAKSSPDETRLIEFTSGEFEEIEAARARVGSPSRPDFYHDAIMKYARELPIEDLDEDNANDGDSSEAPPQDVKQKFRDAAEAFEKMNPPPSLKSVAPGRSNGPSHGGKKTLPPETPSTP